LLPIKDDGFDKPMGEWCGHCRPGRGGCGIYPDRPRSCRDFKCHWLADETWGEEWKPNRSKIIVDMNPIPRPGFLPFDLTFIVDPAYPDRWRASPYYEQIKAHSSRGILTREYRTVVRVGSRAWIIFPDEDREKQGVMDEGKKFDDGRA
jgi:hypothetical protein